MNTTPQYEPFLITRFLLAETLSDSITGDMCKEIKRILLEVLNQVVIGAVRVNIPNAIISFAHFDLIEDTLVISIRHREDRKEIHEYCEKIGLNARTKWTVDEDNPFYMCPYCRQYTADTLVYEDGYMCEAYCNYKWCKGKKENETRCAFTLRQCIGTKNRYISTGQMCIRRSDKVPLPIPHNGTYRKWRNRNQ